MPAAPADEFLSSLERDLPRDASSSSVGAHRTSSSGRRHREDDDPYDRSSRRASRRDADVEDEDRYRSSRGYGHEDKSSRKRRPDRDESPRTSSRRRYDDDNGGTNGADDYYKSSSRRRKDAEDDDDYRGYHSSSRRRHPDDDPYRSSSRRDPYEDDPYENRRARRPYDDSSRRRGGGGGGGGRGGWRDAPREDSPGARRGPIPPGTRPISQRVRSNTKWDQVPEGFEGVSATKAKETGLFGVPGQSRLVGPPGAVIGRDESGQTVIPESLPPLRFGGGEGGAAAGAVQVGSGQTAANRNARRLYVGNVGHQATEQNFKAFWNERLKEMKLTLADGDPSVSATVAPEKGYAFIEFRCPEETTNAMSFDGIIFQGQALKIRRPKDYTGTDLAPPPIHVPGVISTNVPDSPNKIYIGSIPTYLDEGQITELLQSFGEVRAFNLVREANNGPSKGFAFCEYVNPEVTDIACQGLSDIEIGDRKLVAQRASTGQKGASGGVGGNAGGVGAGARSALNITAESGEPTKCMTMLNMVTPQELVDDEEYGEIVEDVREECLKYGQVTDVRIPRPVAQSKGASAQAWSASGGVVTASATAEEAASKEREGVGRVYVRFGQVSECEAALKAIAGRQFGGRLVICAFLKEEDWPSDEDGGESKDATQGMIASAKPAA